MHQCGLSVFGLDTYENFFATHSFPSLLVRLRDSYAGRELGI